MQITNSDIFQVFSYINLFTSGVAGVVGFIVLRKAGDVTKRDGLGSVMLFISSLLFFFNQLYSIQSGAGLMPWTVKFAALFTAIYHIYFSLTLKTTKNAKQELSV